MMTSPTTLENAHDPAGHACVLHRNHFQEGSIMRFSIAILLALSATASAADITYTLENLGGVTGTLTTDGTFGLAYALPIRNGGDWSYKV
jgi:hypothetical protein